MRKKLYAATWIVFGTAALLWAVWPLSPRWVESHYSLRLYPWIARWYVPLTDWCSFPISFYALIGAVVALPCVSAIRWIRGRRDKVPRLRLFLSGTANILLVVLFLYSTFVLLWGAGYHRVSLQSHLQLEAPPPEAPEVTQFFVTLAETIRKNLPADRDRHGAKALAALRRALADVLEGWYGQRPTLPRQVKRLPPGTLLAFGNSGMVSPFTLEALADGALPEVSYLAVATHELAHVAGITHEGDADFAALIAGLRSANSYARYATAVNLFSRFQHELPDAVSVQLFDSLPARARQDLNEIAAALRRHRVALLVSLQRKVYDTHLRVHGVEGGIKDYSRAFRLILEAARRGML